MNDVVTVQPADIRPQASLPASVAPGTVASLSLRTRVLALVGAALGSWGLVVVLGYGVYALVS